LPSALGKRNGLQDKLVEGDNNMEIRLDDLFQRFKDKGFMPVEISGLVKDVFNIIGNSGCSTIITIDQELEEFGWGIGIMDYVTHELITSLIEDNSSTDVERHIHNMDLF
jgi:hypothetical protein